MRIRSGTIDSAQISFSADRKLAGSETSSFEEILKGMRIHDIEDFYPILRQSVMGSQDDIMSISHWLNTMLAIRANIPGY